MKNRLTTLLYREMAGSDANGIVDRVTTLLDRRAKGKKLTSKEEAVVADAEQGLRDILGAPQQGYRPDKPTIALEPSALPFSSFAEGLAQLQNRIQKRGARPKLRTSADAGAYRPDQGDHGGAKNKANAARIAAIVKMARAERARAK